MKTVILYNIISLIIIFVLIFVLRIVSKSDLRKNQQLIIKVITTILIVCVIAFVLFIDAIAVGIIGPVPTSFTAEAFMLVSVHFALSWAEGTAFKDIVHAAVSTPPILV